MDPSHRGEITDLGARSGRDAIEERLDIAEPSDRGETGGARERSRIAGCGADESGAIEETQEI